jgi:hypothetical protein
MKENAEYAKKPGYIKVAALSLLACVGSIFVLWSAHDNLLGWDEVDYVQAALLGVKANMMEEYSLSPSAYLEFSRAKLKKQSPHLPLNYDEDIDTLLKRHYHPPFVVLLLANIPGLNNERVARSVQLIGALLLTLAIFFSYWSISSTPGLFGGAVVSVLVVWLNLNLFWTLSFHGWAAVWVTTTATALSRFLNGNNLIWGVILCVSLALSLLTLETGIFVILIVFAYLIAWKRLVGSKNSAWLSWKKIVVGAGLVGLIIFVFWPGAVLKASLIKIPALYAYRIIRGDEYANVPGMWKGLIRSLLPILLVFGAFIWVLVKDRSRLKYWAPFLVLGVLYTLILARFALSPGYLLPGLAPLVCLVGSVTDQLQTNLGRVAIFAVTVLLIVATGTHNLAQAEDQRVREDLQWLGKLMSNRESLADGAHIYQFYLGQGYRIEPLSLSYNAESLLRRERGEYRELRDDEIAGKLVIIQKRPQQLIGGAAARSLENCLQVEGNHVMVWDCNNTNLKSKAR